MRRSGRLIPRLGRGASDSGHAFRAGRDFPSAWGSWYINAKEMYALQSLLVEYCAACPSTLRGTQVDIDADIQSVTHAFIRSRAR